MLRTFLLPASAISLTLDPVDRAFYAGYEDGSVQSVDFYKSSSVQHPLHDPSLQSTPAQIPADEKWAPPTPQTGAARTLALSHDGMTLLSGHPNGKVLTWNVGRRKYASELADYTHQVTNLIMLPLAGLTGTGATTHTRIAHTIVKPRYDSSLSETSHTAGGAVPAEYTLNTHLLPGSSSLRSPRKPDSNTTSTSSFHSAFTHAYFPSSLLDEGLAELSGLSISPQGAHPVPTASMATSEDTFEKDKQIATLESELATLKQKSTISDAARHASTAEVTQLRANLAHLQDYINELEAKQTQAQREGVLRRARKEARETRRREAWFAAEKKGRKGDTVVRKLDAEESELSSETDDMSSGE